ncbi:hypothetical protein ARMSODRAFT_946550 [Armillaria solidipes]|uniref:Uncharacterized protein n=1 Tax=Armillaria solidipes TaxID=1076256 RepID=A0A2H3C8N2_9AGAR|nr:hypothetical protein ARMSODRAFT_946550 [Armillaria solidipes]
MEGEESAVVDFTVEMLRVLGYEKEDTLVRTRNNLRLLTCGEFVYAKTDVCLLDLESRGQITYQSHGSRFQLIAKAIAAFQKNNKRRARLFLDPLPAQTILVSPWLAPSRSSYKIAVTSELDHCIRHGQCPLFFVTHPVH